MDIYRNGSIECVYVFVKTPTIEDLRRRLEARGTETEETLGKRVGNAEKEVGMGEETGIFSKWLVNGEDREKFLTEAVGYIMKEAYHIQV